MKLIQARYKDLPEMRATLLKKQGYKCKVCNKLLSTNNPKEIHVDHEHFGEHRIRAVLCRRCNTCEGKLWNSYMRSTLKEERGEKDYLNMLRGLLKYKKYKPTRYIHPSVIRKRRKKGKKK